MDSNQQSSYRRQGSRRQPGADEPEPKCPVVDCPLQIDVILESSDSVQYGTHTKSIEAFTSTFPPSKGGVISLPESSDVVSLLLQYMHHQQHPDPIEFEFDILSRLAGAAEKYAVFPALEVCKIYMREAISQHPVPVLKYAAMHHYPELCDLAAPRTVSLPLDHARVIWQDEPDILFAWIRYRESCLELMLSTFDDSMLNQCHCQFYDNVLSLIGSDLRQLWNVCSFVRANKSTCRCYTMVRYDGIDSFEARFSHRIATLPKFSSVLASKSDGVSITTCLTNSITTCLNNLMSFVLEFINTTLVTPARAPAMLSELPMCPVAGCHLEVDIILKSSDGIQFGSHVKNLETYSEAFPPSEFRDIRTPHTEVVSLPESSSVVSLLLQYMHKHHRQDSSGLQFDVLSQLAEAAEKYMVFSATQVCKIRMKAAIKEHPFSVLQYAAIHNYPELSNLAAPLTISLSFQEVKKHLRDKPNILFAWLRYRECWLRILSSTFDDRTAPVCSCRKWLILFHSFLAKIGQDLGAMRDMDKFKPLSALQNCPSCIAGAKSWQTSVRSRIANLPTFSSFL